MKFLELERLYPAPKNSLLSIYSIVGNELNDQTVLTSYGKQIRNQWEWNFNVKWPEIMSFKGIGKTKVIASKNAALKTLLWLEINGKLRNGKPILYNNEQIKNMRLKPKELSITPEILGNIKDLIKIYDTVIS